MSQNRPRLKYGRSDQEGYLFKVWSDFITTLNYTYRQRVSYNVSIYDDAIIHFECGAKFHNTKDKNKYPDVCKICGKHLREYSHCMPDIYLDIWQPTINAIPIFIHDPTGKIHGKDKRRKKDTFQMDVLEKLKYKPYVLTNDLIQNLSISAARFLLIGIIEGVSSNFYNLIMDNENDIGDYYSYKRGKRGEDPQ